MSKILLFLSSVLASVFVMQVHKDDITLNDVLSVGEEVELEEKDDWEVVVDFSLLQELFEAWENHPHNNDKLEIFAVGDMMLGRHVRVLMDQYGQDYILDEVREFNLDMAEKVDVMHGNLEGPILGEGRKGGTSMVFQFNEDVGEYLVREGFNLVSLANNHSLDAGWEGYENSKKVLEENGVGWCGHPTEADVGSVHYGQAGKRSYAFVCFHDVTSRLDQAAAVELISQMDKEVDFVVVSIHWGYEYKLIAHNNAQVGPAHAFVDAGADLILGHHPHVVQNHEIYKDRLIMYSLGNYIFDQYWSRNTQRGMTVKVELYKDIFGNVQTNYELFPVRMERAKVILE